VPIHHLATQNQLVIESALYDWFERDHHPAKSVNTLLVRHLTLFVVQPSMVPVLQEVRTEPRQMEAQQEVAPEEHLHRVVECLEFLNS
jgi:hypothetical protein